MEPEWKHGGKKVKPGLEKRFNRSEVKLLSNVTKKTMTTVFCAWTKIKRYMKFAGKVKINCYLNYIIAE